MDGMREPYILTHPVHRLHVPDRPVTELLQAEGLFILCFSQVRVKMHTVAPGKSSALLH